MSAAPDAPDRMAGRRPVLALAGFFLLCLAVSAAGGAVTASSVSTWYQTLAKPSFNPPDWVFAPVWSTLYAMMAIAGWLVWRRAGVAGARGALALYGLQLALNLGWSVLFFGLRAPGWALVEIVPLWAAIAATMVAFWRIDRLAGVLFAPYLCWVGFAVVLNAAIWRLN